VPSFFIIWRNLMLFVFTIVCPAETKLPNLAPAEGGGDAGIPLAAGALFGGGAAMAGEPGTFEGAEACWEIPGGSVQRDSFVLVFHQ
jgi:hypothetical protein